MRVPELRSGRLLIREFTLGDLSAVELLDVELAGGLEPGERRRWLEWTVLGYAQLDALHQPPYGDRAIELAASGELIGACGYAPCLGPFHQIPGLPVGGAGYSSEVGLYWAVSPRRQRQGYATEAGAALIRYAFSELHLGRVVATTEYTNTASIGVMRKLGMHLGRNASAEPPWLQVVAHLDNPS